VLLHVLRHVDAHHRVLVIEQELGEGSRRLRLPHARRAEEDERANGAIRILESSARAAHGIRHSMNGLGLPDHALAQVRLQLR
jgi:hypothetical protein